MWGETHSRSTNYRDTSAGFVSLFAAVGRGVLVLVVIGIVTATAMDTPALSHTHIAIWPYMGIPRENQRTRRQTFAYVALAFSDTDALTSHFFFVFAACTSYVMLEFHFCCNALGENCNILLRFLHRSPPPLHLWKCFSRCFPTVFSSISRSCFALYFDVLVDSGWIELKRIVGYAVMILIEEQMRKAVNLLLKTPNCVVLSMKLL